MKAPAFEFRVLDESHNEDLLAINRACPVEAVFTVLFDRGPNFFAWPKQAFEDFVYLGAFDSGRPVGYCALGFHRSWVGGDWVTVAHIADARVVSEARGQGLLLLFLQRFMEQFGHRVSLACAVVMGGNRPAEKVASKWKVPAYPVLQSYPFDIVTLPLMRRFARTDDFQIRSAVLADAPAVAACIQQAYTGRFLAPHIDEDALLEMWNRDDGLGPKDWLLAEKGGRLVGAAAFSDEGRSREIIIQKYHPRSLPLKAVFRLATTIFRSAAPLPAPGGTLKRLTLRWPAVEEDDPAILRALVVAALSRYHGDGYHFIQASFAKGDPLKSALRGLWGYDSPNALIVAGQGPELTGTEIPFIGMGTI